MSKIFRDINEVKETALSTNKTLVVYKGKVLDATTFQDDHPGGGDLIHSRNGEDITGIFHDEDSHSHSKSAVKMMDKFQIGVLTTSPTTNSDTETDKLSEEQGTKATNEVSYPIITQEKIIYEDFEINLKKGATSQLMNLPLAKYLQVIHSPVHVQNLRMFDWDFVEMFSKTNWYLIPIVWVPVAFLSIFYATLYITEPVGALDRYLQVNSPQYSQWSVVIAIITGIFLWTKLEYVLHRFLFHLDEHIPDHPAAIWFHFMLHGIHHFVPMDKYRLVFPPAAGVIAVTIVQAGVGLLASGSLKYLFVAGMLIGYIAYDLTHYYLHHGKPSVAYFEDLKTYHTKHHYKNPSAGFGVSNKLWDYVYKTQLK